MTASRAQLLRNQGRGICALPIQQLPTAAAFLPSNHYDMLETTMYVKCTHCGYDNSPEYRFCGMCGASLAHPPAVEATPAKEAPRAPKSGNGHTEPVHGPSFLGLADDPKVEFHYLYEDEQPKSRVGLILMLFIAFGAAGYLGWQWKHNGFPFNRIGAGAGQQASASPSEVAPATNSDQQTHIDKPMTGMGEVLPTQPDQNAQNQTKTGPTEKDIPPQNAGAAQDTGTQQNGTPQQNAGASQNGSAAANSPESAAEKQNAVSDNTSEKTEEANATPPPGVAKASRVAKEPARIRAVKPSPVNPAPVATSPDVDLELAGERYLYGNGVPQNCARAESSLRTAAMHANSKAQTVLGTMYATGHCVGRDLPSAYRWFARALHEEPQNGRISADLQVLWRQMTPQEKQLATTSGQ
jgi:zinc-ribbon domain